MGGAKYLLENDGGFHLREETATYIANFDSENDNMGGESNYSGNINPLLSVGYRGPTPLLHTAHCSLLPHYSH